MTTESQEEKRIKFESFIDSQGSNSYLDRMSNIVRSSFKDEELVSMDNQTLIKNLAAKAHRREDQSRRSDTSSDDSNGQLFDKLELLMQIEFFKGKKRDL